MKEIAQSQKFTLDNSLRNLYLTLRNQGCLLMAIKFEYNGTTYYADTAAEAATLQRELKQYDTLFGTRWDESAQKVWTADRALDLINGIGELQKRFLAELSAHGASIDSKTLAEKMGIESGIALAGVVSGLSKQLQKMSINPASLYRVDVTWKGKDKVRFFVLSSDFRDALNEIGWPDAWQTGKENSAPSTSNKRK